MPNPDKPSLWTAVTDALCRFLDGGRMFNLINMALAVVGVGLAVWALWMALVQLRKTMTAAKSAQTAAEATRAQLLNVANYVSLQRVCGIAGEAALAVRVDERVIASLRLNDLRIGAAQARATDAQSDNQQSKWQSVMTKIASAQESVATRTRNGKPPVGTREDAMRLITEIQEALQELSALEAHKLGEINAIV